MVHYTLNSDMGEALGLHSFGNDVRLMELIDIANVACGYHAGDPNVMEETIALARQHRVKVGAHPGLPDIVGFGRRSMALHSRDARTIITYQVGALVAFLEAENMQLNHIKPHGALYGMLSRDEELMREAAGVAKNYDVPFLGLSGTAHEKVCRDMGVEFVGELYVDLDYSDQGILLIKAHPEEKSPEEVAQRTIQALETGTILSENGKEIAVDFRSICVHSDGPRSVEIAHAVREVLDRKGHAHV
ncbi:5-oxoprolinase subunit PxpA [Corynebacterium sp. sy039]|uniref:5-oxoprolinase subunit PxpA n=1 Tax=Corynebacterium sp. sy039 TaxID=2599641 RepID=UPI0011B414B4|nr:5-oxoprolinase subunit PxpA [Corynebacterium sp. sy039]QDZ41747.1 5-oxoprolinase subunit PxpA [Corynebacterium sp. sy039]